MAEEADRYSARPVRAVVMVPLRPCFELLPPVVDLQLPSAFAAPTGCIRCLRLIGSGSTRSPAAHLGQRAVGVRGLEQMNCHLALCVPEFPMEIGICLGPRIAHGGCARSPSETPCEHKMATEEMLRVTMVKNPTWVSRVEVGWEARGCKACGCLFRASAKDPSPMALSGRLAALGPKHSEVERPHHQENHVLHQVIVFWGNTEYATQGQRLSVQKVWAPRWPIPA